MRDISSLKYNAIPRATSLSRSADSSTYYSGNDDDTNDDKQYPEGAFRNATDSVGLRGIVTGMTV
jgi:hypothetical protein